MKMSFGSQLLRSLLLKVDASAEKSKPKVIQDDSVNVTSKDECRPKTKVSSIPPPAKESRNKSPTVPKAVISRPKVGKFVINFSDDEDENDEKEAITMKIDSLLSSARMASSSSSKLSSSQPLRGSALGKLSKTSQNEYLWLKEQMKAREIKAAGVLGQLKHNQEKMVEIKNSMDMKKQSIPVLKSKLSNKKEQVQKAQKHANKMAELFKAAQKILKQKVNEVDEVSNQLKEIQNTLRTEQQEFRVIEQECSSLKIQLEGSPIKRTASTAQLEVSKPIAKKPKLDSKVETIGTLVSKPITSPLKPSTSANQGDVYPSPEIQFQSSEMKGKLVITSSPLKRSVIVGPSSKEDIVLTQEPTHKEPNQENDLQCSRVVKSRRVRKRKRGDAHVVDFYESLRNLMLSLDNVKEVNVNTVDSVGDHGFCEVAQGIASSESGSGDQNTFNYESVLTHLHSYRFSKNFLKNKDHSLLDPVSCNDVDPNVIICNTELTEGTCSEPGCEMQHKSKYLLNDPVSQMVDILLYNPSLAGVSNKAIKKGSTESIEKLKMFIIKLSNDMKSKGIADHEQVALELVRKIKEESPNDNIATLTRRIRGRFRSRAVLTFGNFQYDFSLSARGDPVMKFTKIVSDNQENQNPFENEERAPKVRFFTKNANSDSIPDVTSLNPEEITKLGLDTLAKGPRSSQKVCKRALQILARGLDIHPKSAILWREYLSLFQTFQAFKL